MESIFYPIQRFSDWITKKVCHFDSEVLSDAVNFFIFDTIKIFVLVIITIFSLSLIRSFFPIEKIKKILTQEKYLLGHAFAATLGIVTPFCSCSAVPLFLGFIEVGVPLGITFSFLISSPMINEVALALLFGAFGIKVALMYILSGWLIAFFAGIIIGKLKIENLLKFTPLSHESLKCVCNRESKTLINRVSNSAKYTYDIFIKIWAYVILGVGVGAFIHGYVPTDFLTKYAGNDKWYGVIIATIIGIPLYSNAAGVIPLISALTEKGVSIGTSLAFMMAITGLSFPEFIILKKIMKTKLILIFALIVGFGIVFTGYLFNFIINH